MSVSDVRASLRLELDEQVLVGSESEHLAAGQGEEGVAGGGVEGERTRPGLRDKRPAVAPCGGGHGAPAAARSTNTASESPTDATTTRRSECRTNAMVAVVPALAPVTLATWSKRRSHSMNAPATAPGLANPGALRQ